MGGEDDLRLLCVSLKAEHAVQRLHQHPDAANVELLQLHVVRRLPPDLHLGAERYFCRDNSFIYAAKDRRRRFLFGRARLGLVELHLLVLVNQKIEGVDFDELIISNLLQNQLHK